LARLKVGLISGSLLDKKRLGTLVSKFFYRPDHTAFRYAECPYNIYLAANTAFNQLRRDQFAIAFFIPLIILQPFETISFADKFIA
jgi:hypothetical protein